MADRTKVTIVVLSIVILVLAVFMLYYFVIQPQIQGYVIQKQTEGMVYTVNTILAQIQQYGYVHIPVNENQTLILVPYVPPEQTQVSGETGTTA